MVISTKVTQDIKGFTNSFCRLGVLLVYPLLPLWVWRDVAYKIYPTAFSLFTIASWCNVHSICTYLVYITVHLMTGERQVCLEI